MPNHPDIRTNTSTATIVKLSIKHRMKVENGVSFNSSGDGACMHKKFAWRIKTNSIETIRSNSIFDSLTFFVLDTCIINLKIRIVGLSSVILKRRHESLVFQQSFIVFQAERVEYFSLHSCPRNRIIGISAKNVLSRMRSKLFGIGKKAISDSSVPFGSKSSTWPANERTITHQISPMMIKVVL